jgi:hypothetical protein
LGNERLRRGGFGCRAVFFSNGLSAINPHDEARG